MRGKTKIHTRYNSFKSFILAKFPNASREPGEAFSYLVSYLENQNCLDHAALSWCDNDECLLFDQSNPATAIYQVLRIADRPVLFRELDNLAEAIWGQNAGSNPGKLNLSTAICLLVGVNLLDYNIRETFPNDTLGNVLQFFIKDE